jgi:hypothetical protein
MLDETLPQREDLRESGENHVPRWGFPSVRPLATFPRDFRDRKGESKYIDPSLDREFTATDFSPLRRNASSVASSFRSATSVAPSSLRYVGLQPVTNYSPAVFLDRSIASKLQCSPAHRRPPAPQYPSVAEHAVTHHRPFEAQEVHTAESAQRTSTCFPVCHSGPRDPANESFSTPQHPLLKQALLLTAAAEVEERLAICQAEAGAFDDILALFSVAKEVEAVRVAAFDMFKLEADARRALYAQQTRERRILWYCCLESRNNAVLSQEVRTLQLRETQFTFKQLESLLRSRSTSLQQNSSNLFDSKLTRGTLTALQGRVPSTVVEHTTGGNASLSPKRQLSYPASRKPRNSSPVVNSNSKSRRTTTSASSSYSTSSASSPTQFEGSESQSTGSLYVSSEHHLPAVEERNTLTESALDERIARQQLLLANGGAAHASLGAPLFPKRSAPKHPLL